MKVETVRTTTLYLTLAPSEITLMQAASWRELPPLSHDLVLYPSLDSGLARMEHEAPGDRSQRSNRPQFLARIQLRAGRLSGLDPHPSDRDRLELHVPPEQIDDLNRNLVGPVVLLEGLAAGAIPALQTPCAHDGREDRERGN